MRTWMTGPPVPATPPPAGLLLSSHLLCWLGHKVIPQGTEDKAQGIPELVAEMAVVQDLRDRQVQVAPLGEKNKKSTHPQPLGLSTLAHTGPPRSTRSTQPGPHGPHESTRVHTGPHRSTRSTQVHMSPHRSTQAHMAHTGPLSHIAHQAYPEFHGSIVQTSGHPSHTQGSRKESPFSAAKGRQVWPVPSRQRRLAVKRPG